MRTAALKSRSAKEMLKVRPDFMNLFFSHTMEALGGKMFPAME